MIKDFWNSDLDIEIIRSKYTIILESDVEYEYERDENNECIGVSKRKTQNIRGVYVDKGKDFAECIVGTYDNSFSNPDEVIKFLKKNIDSNGELK